ncbi:MAG: tail fiber domain-containing protein [Saprospiraceae bacterium]|nr:tail fiber domain-containing protein [Saprospiraceae bacterium]
MKNVKISVTFFCIFSFLFVNKTFSQIKVNTTGELKIGNEWPNNDNNNEVSIETFGLNNNAFRPGGKISFGDYGSSANNNANATVGELGTGDSDALQLHGKNGVYITTGGQGNFEVARFNSWGSLEVRGSVIANSSTYSSDERLKKNIKSLLNALQVIKKLRGISYDWKTDKEDELLTSLQSVRTTDDKGARDLEKSKKEAKDRIKESTDQIGFSAQEVQTVLPQLVKTSSIGMLSVNYVSVIPVLVEGIKEQQIIIDAQAVEIENLKKDIIAIKRRIGR